MPAWNELRWYDAGNQLTYLTHETDPTKFYALSSKRDGRYSLYLNNGSQEDSGWVFSATMDLDLVEAACIVAGLEVLPYKRIPRAAGWDDVREWYQNVYGVSDAA